MTARRHHSGGFSLIELMVVVAIIGMLAATVTMSLMNSTIRAKRTKVAADFKTLQDAIQLYKLQSGKWPQRLEDLVNGKAHVMDKLPHDPWQHEYVYAPPAGSNAFSIKSYAADGTPGGTGEDEDLDLDNVEKLCNE